MAAIVFGLLSAMLYGSADFLGGLASRRSSVVPVMILSQLAGLLTLLVVLPFLPAATPGRADWAWGAVAGGAVGIGLMLLYQGLATGPMSVVAPVTGVLAIVVSALIGLLIGERLSAGAIAGVVLAVAAIALVSQTPAREDPETGSAGVSARGLITAGAAGVLIGLFFAALEQTDPLSGLWPLAPARVSSLVVLGGIGLWRRAPLRVGRDVGWLAVVAGTLDILANVFYLLATRHGTLTIAATLTSLYPASTILLARVVLGERLSRAQIAGLGCAAAGVTLLAG